MHNLTTNCILLYNRFGLVGTRGKVDFLMQTDAKMLHTLHLLPWEKDHPCGLHECGQWDQIMFLRIASSSSPSIWSAYSLFSLLNFPIPSVWSMYVFSSTPHIEFISYFPLFFILLFFSFFCIDVPSTLTFTYIAYEELKGCGQSFFWPMAFF